MIVELFYYSNFPSWYKRRYTRMRLTHIYGTSLVTLSMKPSKPKPFRLAATVNASPD